SSCSATYDKAAAQRAPPPLPPPAPPDQARGRHLRRGAGRSRALVTDRSLPLRQIPVEDLLAGPEQNARMLPDVRERGAEIFEAVRRAHDVGVYDQRHDPRGVVRIRVELVELVAGAVVVLARLVM